MATTVTLDSDLVEEVKSISGKSTKAEAVREALTEYVRAKRRKDLLGLQGKIAIRYTNDQIEGLEDEEPHS